MSLILKTAINNNYLNLYCTLCIVTMFYLLAQKKPDRFCREAVHVHVLVSVKMYFINIVKTLKSTG